MARTRVLKGVAHNIGHSFTSTLNYADDDYVMGHILRFARNTGCDTFTLDFVTGKASPQELLQEPISLVPQRYRDFFWDLVKRHGSDPSCVKAATLTLHYDIGVRRPLGRDPQVEESPYKCDVRITSTGGKEYSAHFQGYWNPETLEAKNKSPWWRFWAKRF